jgi:hypothetical protein
MPSYGMATLTDAHVTSDNATEQTVERERRATSDFKQRFLGRRHVNRSALCGQSTGAHHMLRIAAGAIVGGAFYYATSHALLSAGVLAVTGIVCQITYARRLNALLGGADPVATYGARSLGELKTAIAIPGSIQFLEFCAKSCGWGIIAVAILWFQSPNKLSSEDERNLERFARAYQEKRLATREFNDALGSGTGVVVTLPKNTVDHLIERYERALELSKATRPDVLNRVHPELNQIVRDHFEPSLQLSADAFRTGDPATSLEAQRHANAFGDWWDAHRKDMPILKRVMKTIEGEYNY